MRPVRLACIAALALAPAAAIAQSPAPSTTAASPAPATSSTSSAPPGAVDNNGHHASAARMAIVRGMTAYLSHSYDDALAAFREAAAGEPERAEATVDIGYTLNAKGDHDGAVAAFREAIGYATTGNDDMDRVRALQAIANIYEATRQWPQALTAWQDFVNFAEAHATIANAANGRQRIDAIHARDELEQRTAPVRQRIEQRRQQNAHGPQQQQTP